MRNLNKTTKPRLSDRMTVTVDRNTTFNPEQFFGEGWSVAWQHRDAHLIEEFDLRDLIIATCTADDESMTTSDERMLRMDARGLVPLDMPAFISLWEKRDLFPVEWEGMIRDWFACHFVAGTKLRNPKGDEVFLYFTFRAGQWIYETRPTNRELYYNSTMPSLELF